MLTFTPWKDSWTAWAITCEMLCLRMSSPSLDPISMGSRSASFSTRKLRSTLTPFTFAATADLSDAFFQFVRISLTAIPDSWVAEEPSGK